MNFLDIILICLVAIFALRGAFRGLVQEVISLLAIVIAIYLASNFRHLLIPHLEVYIQNEVTVSGLAYAIVFFGTLILCWLAAKGIKTVLKISLLGWLDRVTGAIFGIIEGVLIGLIVIMAFQTFAPQSDWYTGSKIAPQAQHLVDKLSDIAPESFHDLFSSEGITLPSSDNLMDTAQDAMNQ